MEFFGASVHECFGPADAVHKDDVPNPNGDSAVLVKQSQSQQFGNGDVDSAPFMGALNKLDSFVREPIVGTQIVDRAHLETVHASEVPYVFAHDRLLHFRCLQLCWVVKPQNFLEGTERR